MRYNLDDKDVGILSILLKNSRMSSRKIAEKLNLHPKTVIERIKKMEKEGIIKGYTVQVDYKKLGYPIAALLQIDIEGKTDPLLRKVALLPNVKEVYRTTGEYDGIALVKCRNIGELGQVVNQINRLEGVQRINTKVILGIFETKWHPL